MITVTGGLGFIGSHLVDALAKRGDHVSVIDDARSMGPSILTMPAFVDEWPRRVDVDLSAVAEAQPPVSDTIYHLAGPVGPVGVLAQAGRIAYDVITDAARVARWARKWDAVLVYVSTSEIYGPQGSPDVYLDKQLISRGTTRPIPETANRIFLAGHSARMEYAVAKLAAETMLLNTPGLDVRIIRPFNVAGPRQKPDGGFVLPRFIDQAKAGDPVTVYTPGTQERAFTHVLDIVDGIVKAGTQGKPGDIFNLGNADNRCSILTLANEVIKTLESPSYIEIVDPVKIWGPAFREAPDKIPDATKARQELGWEPTRDRLTTIRDAWLS